MNLPKIITDLIKAQDKHDSVAYAACFSENGVVFDEGKTYKGRTEIQQWIAKANEKYQTLMKPLALTEAGTKSVLSTETSGTFPGSPIVLNFNFEIIDGLIQSLKVTD
ncbi:MAG: nuclear transport factor 2 family protein [Bacteroidota bacterium]